MCETLVRPRARSCIAIICSMAALVSSTPAAAGDGRIPINQSKVLAGGVTSGDTAGFPATISQTGSYFLAGDLSIDENTTAILVTANDVTIDLNGFAIRGPTTCTGSISCTPTGTGRGIDADGQEGLVVYGGTIEGTGSDGIRAGVAARIEDISFRDIGDSSVILGVDAFILNTRSERVQTGALVAASQCHAANNSVFNAGGDGIIAGSASIMRNNTIADVTTGIDLFPGIGGIVVGNSVNSTTSLGVNGSGIVLIDNSINFSTLSAAAGTAVLGIGNVLQGSTSSRGFQGSGIFIENTIQNNASWGLELFDGGYGLNIINDNNGGLETQVSGGAAADQISFNICQVDFTCP